MDWGLLVPDKRSPFGYRLREPLLVTKRKGMYVLLCIFNFLLRFVWSLSVFGGVSGRGAGMFFFEAVEILRRTVRSLTLPASPSATHPSPSQPLLSLTLRRPPCGVFNLSPSPHHEVYRDEVATLICRAPGHNSSPRPKQSIGPTWANRGTGERNINMFLVFVCCSIYFLYGFHW